jgi:hypothetical protein
MPKVQFLVRENKFTTWQEIDLDYLVVSNNSTDLLLVNEFIRKGIVACSLGMDNCFDEVTKNHRPIMIYNQTDQITKTMDFPGQLNTDYIHVFFFGDINKQHALISRMCLAPDVNRHKLNLSDKAGIWYPVTIEPDILKYKHCNIEEISTSFAR